MLRQTCFLLAGLLLAGFAASTASAQFGTGGGGVADFQMRQIRNQSIGNNFSVDAVNRQTLMQGVAQLPQTGVPSINRNLSRPSNIGSRRPAQRPFSNLNRRPTVSPYLQLFNSENSFDPGFSTDYQTLVRPQLEQRRVNEQLRRESAQLELRLQNIAAQPAFRPTGNQNLAPTGFGASTYRYYSHFYPQIR